MGSFSTSSNIKVFTSLNRLKSSLSKSYRQETAKADHKSKITKTKSYSAPIRSTRGLRSNDYKQNSLQFNFTQKFSMVEKSSLNFIVLLALFFVSCGDQSADPIAPDRGFSGDEIVRAKSCQNTVFENGFLKHENLKHLFPCMGWEKQHPHLYEKLLEISPQRWDHLMTPMVFILVIKRGREKIIFSRPQAVSIKRKAQNLLVQYFPA